MGWASTWDDSTPASSLQPTKAEPPKKGGDGIGGALGKGIMSGGASVGRAAELAGAAPLVIADKVAGTDLAQQYFEAVDPVMQSADDYWRIDPETGHVGQVAYGLGRIVLPLAAGGGNPTTMMAGEGANAAVTGVQQGATTQEATGAAAMTALTFGVGAMVPGAVGGNAATKIGSGAAINMAIGAGYREGMQAVYADNPDILKTLPGPGDPTAVATDATIGAAFGGIAALASRNRNRPLPDRDAEAQAQVASHVDQVTQATSPQQRQASSDALSTAQRQMRDGEAVRVAQQAQANDARSLVSASRAPVQQADLSRLPSGAQVVAEAAHSAGIEASLALAMAHHETGGRFNSDAQNPDSSAHGIGQITDATWQQYGGGNRADPKEQARVMMEVIKSYRQDAAGVLGRDPTAGETYLAYQWGPGGFAKAMKDTTAKVEDVLGAKAAKDNGWTGKTVAQALDQTNARFDKLTRLYGGQARGGVAYTASGDQVAYAYQAMEAGDLTASHLPDLSVNPAFPPELQPRDRTRAASEDQISQIDLSLQPARLMDSPMVTDGAPIVGLDGVVESGNGRTLAIGRHYERGDPNGYRQALLDNADALGLLRSEIEQMQRPVLVRTRLSDVADRATFARDANASTVAAMSASERASSDVSRLPDASLLAVREDGTINMGGSMNYVRGFVDALPETERASMMTADGHLSQEGQRRIETAIVHQAYGDGALVERLSEHTDAQGKNILSALVRSAAPLAQLDALVRQGGRHENAVARDVAEAAQRYSDIRASGQTVHDYLQQNMLLDDGLSDGARSMLEVMGDNSRSPKAIAEEIQRRIDAVDQMGDPRQGGLFGEAVPEPVRTVQNQIADQLAALGRFDDQYVQDVSQVAASMYEATARELGITAEQMLERYPLRIEAGDTAGGAVYHQSPRSELAAVRRQHEGKPTWMKAPNGQPTKLTEQQWLQVRTPRFKKWFGDWEGDPANASKAVDENGEPKLMYRGDPTSWTVWDDTLGGGLIHMGDSQGVAEYYAHGRGGGRQHKSDPVYTNVRTGEQYQIEPSGHSYVNLATNERIPTAEFDRIQRQLDDMGELKIEYPGAEVKTLFADLRNPLDLRRAGRADGHREASKVLTDLLPILERRADRSPSEPLREAIILLQNMNTNEVGFGWGSTKNEFASKAWRDVLVPLLKRRGYDGLMFGDDSHYTWTVFDGEQIKSATDNAGTFSPKSDNINHQAGEHGPRASIDFSPDQLGSLIRLGQQADTSSFVHELGHHGLEMNMQVALSVDAPAGLRADMDTVMQWAGHRSAEDWAGLTPEQRTQVHEQFAETFERYTASGHAPTPELQGAFSRLKQWMVDAYQTLKALMAGTPNAKLSPEIEQVMARMLGAQREAAPAQAWHSPETPEQQAAFDLMQQNPDLVLANEAGEPVSVRDVMAQLEAEHAMTQEQTTATEAAVSCALQFGD